MCQIFNKHVKGGEDIIAYKIVYAGRDQFYTIYQHFPMKIGEEYFTRRTWPYLAGFAIERGFFHSYKYLEDAKRWINRRLAYTPPGSNCPKYHIMKVLISNTKRDDYVYAGVFQSDYAGSVPTYASNRIKLLEDVSSL